MARILIVEDDLDLCERVELWLTHEEHDIESASDGFAALELITSRTYDLIILDWDLPGMSGLDICKTFRSGHGNTPILMLTGHGNVSDKEAGFDAGADDYLTKPFHLKELSARVRAMLRRSSLTEATKQSSARAHPDVFYKRCPECGLSYALDKEHCDEDQTLLSTEKVDPALRAVFAEHYEIESVIGSGGMSVVYKARHKLMDRIVAIKLLDPRLVRLQSAVRRFQLEAQAASRLNHPNVIVVHDFGITPDNQPYLVMDFLNGKSLQALLDENTQLPSDRARKIFRQTAAGLGHAHKCGVIHRDVKPNNIIIDWDFAGEETVKIVDFGIAKLVGNSTSPGERLTKAGEIFGTALYMSPEQCRGKDVDRRSDIYSLGCVMFETLTGLPPFEGENDLDTIQMQLSAQPPSMSERRPDLKIAPELEKIVNRALEKAADNRYQSMEELQSDLSQLTA